MQTSTLAQSPRWRRSPRPWLICLDLQRNHVVPGRPGYSAGNAAVVEACGRVLSFARAEGWRIAHSQLRRDDDHPWPGQLFGAPIEGLRPLISEPVFMRRGLSAFADPAFAEALGAARGEEVYLVGFSLADTCLATALAAFDEGLSVTLIDDAVGVGAAAASAAARTVLTPFVRLVSSHRLEAAAALEVAP